MRTTSNGREISAEEVSIAANISVQAFLKSLESTLVDYLHSSNSLVLDDMRQAMEESTNEPGTARLNLQQIAEFCHLAGIAFGRLVGNISVR
jgi:hypothetical protein